MSPLLIALGVLMFAVVTAVLFVWGMRKAYFQRETLTKMLLSKSADRVIGYLKTHKSITEPQMRRLVEGIRASEFYSRRRATVQADKAFTSRLIEVMMSEGLIEPVGNKAVYRKKAISKDKG